MHVIFVYSVRAAFRTKIKCMRKVQSMPENLQRSATVRKFHAYERLESPGHENGHENWVRTKYSGFTVAWNSETHWLTSFDASLIHLDRRWTCSADYDSCSLISEASWSISLSQAVAPSLCLLVMVIFSSVWKTRFKFVSIYYFDPSTCHLSANMNDVQHDK